MKNSVKKVLFLLILSATVLVLAGCAREPEIPEIDTYTVWSFSATQTFFNSEFNPGLSDVNVYEPYELSATKYAALKSDLSSSGIQPVNLTEDQISGWFTNAGFNTAQVSYLTSWIIESPKRMIAVCLSGETENVVYCLLH